MKNKFIEYHMNDYIEGIFREAIVILDTNVLLNLYRYSKATREKYLEILTQVKERFFLPYQVCQEFYKNKLFAL